MHEKLRVALVAALLMTGGWGASASATSDGEDCERNGHNASGCDFDGDGTINKDDPDDDGDGTPDDEDDCRGADGTCEEEGGDSPALPEDPADVIAQVEELVAEVVAQLPPAPGGEEPPAEEPDPAAQVQAIVDGIVAQLPAPPAP